MFLRRTCRPLSRPLTRLNSTVSVAAPAEESPRPSFFTRQTIYPFLLLSLLTSLALNLSHGRAQHIEASAVLRAQISVLTTLKARLLAAASSSPRKLSHEDRERVERELEMVGLGKAKGRTTKDDREEGTSWKEVFLGKKGNGFTTDRMDNEGVRGQEEEEFDWAKLVKEAEAAEVARSRPRNRVIAPPPQQNQSTTAEDGSNQPTLATFL